MAPLICGPDLPRGGKASVLFRLPGPDEFAPFGSPDLTKLTIRVLNSIREELDSAHIETSAPVIGKVGQGGIVCPASTGKVGLMAIGATTKAERWALLTSFLTGEKKNNASLTPADRLLWEQICSHIEYALRTRLFVTDLEWVTFEQADRGY